jgi:hypothetical protein
MFFLGQALQRITVFPGCGLIPHLRRPIFGGLFGFAA